MFEEGFRELMEPVHATTLGQAASERTGYSSDDSDSSSSTLNDESGDNQARCRRMAAAWYWVAYSPDARVDGNHPSRLFSFPWIAAHFLELNKREADDLYDKPS